MTAHIAASLCMALSVGAAGCYRVHGRGREPALDAAGRPTDASVDVARGSDVGESFDAAVGRDARVTSDAFVGTDAFVVLPDVFVMSDAYVADPVCVTVLADPRAAPDDELWRCGHTRGLGACWIFDGCDGCSCAAYVRSDEICTETCAAPLSGTGCSDASYYARAPFFCMGDRVTQSACMLRYLISNGFCDGR